MSLLNLVAEGFASEINKTAEGTVRERGRGLRIRCGCLADRPTLLFPELADWKPRPRI